jgi:hypothetical protein
MLRLIEVALFLTPFAAFLAWRLTSAGGGPSPTFVAVTAGCVIVLLVGLLWYGGAGSLGRGQTYVPARLEDGRIVPGHAAP